MMRAWHRKRKPKLCQFPQLVRDPLSIHGGSITRFKAKKMKVHNRLLLTQNDIKHVHTGCESPTQEQISFLSDSEANWGEIGEG